jgi:ATP-binding cassette subfamily B protein
MLATARSTVGLYARAMRLLVEADSRLMATQTVLVLILGLLAPATLWVYKMLVDRAANASYFGSLQLSAAIAMGTYIALGAVRAAVEPIQQAVGANLQDRVLMLMDRRLMDAAARIADTTPFDRPILYDNLRLAKEAAFRPLRLTVLLRDFASSLLAIAGSLLVLVYLHPLLPAALAMLLLPHMRAHSRLGVTRWSWMAMHSRHAREMDYCERVLLDPSFAKDVRAYDLMAFFQARYRALAHRALQEMRAWRLRPTQLAAGFGALYGMGVAGSLWLTARQVANGRLTVGDVALFLAAVQQIWQQGSFVANWLGAMQEFTLHLRRLFDFLDNSRPLIRIAPACEAKRPPIRPCRGLAFDHVTLVYPARSGGSRPALHNVTFRARPGEVVALVGPNGAGKSSIIKLLTRMCDPTEGNVTLDGVPLWEYDLDLLRSRMAVIFQDFARFSLTLHQNVVVGNIDRIWDDSRFRQVSRAVGLEQLACSFPQGPHTPLTRRFEGGIELSGGQWQKVALARGYFRAGLQSTSDCIIPTSAAAERPAIPRATDQPPSCDADVFLVALDEPTAALDAKAEADVFKHFRSLVGGRSALLISHRLSCGPLADRIIVLERGRVIEEGTHQELLASGGRYAALFQMQARQYHQI